MSNNGQMLRYQIIDFEIIELLAKIVKKYYTK